MGRGTERPSPHQKINFFLLKKLKIQHVLYMNYPNLVASVWIGIRTNSSRELFTRTIRANNSRQCETGFRHSTCCVAASGEYAGNLSQKLCQNLHDMPDWYVSKTSRRRDSWSRGSTASECCHKVWCAKTWMVSKAVSRSDGLEVTGCGWTYHNLFLSTARFQPPVSPVMVVVQFKTYFTLILYIVAFCQLFIKDNG